MLILKISLKINCILKLLIYKTIYRNKLIIGKNLNFRKGFSLIIDGKNAKVRIGDNVFFNNFCTIASMQNIIIGNNTIFGENVKIYDHNHQYKDPDIAIKYQGYKTAAITIGENCWIASNVIILKGVSIGDHCVIGAGCIINRDIPENTILYVNQENIKKNIV